VVPHTLLHANAVETVNTRVSNATAHICGAQSHARSYYLLPRPWPECCSAPTYTAALATLLYSTLGPAYNAHAHNRTRDHIFGCRRYGDLSDRSADGLHYDETSQYAVLGDILNTASAGLRYV
jgi:hypothetical protein